MSQRERICFHCHGHFYHSLFAANIPPLLVVAVHLDRIDTYTIIENKKGRFLILLTLFHFTISLLELLFHLSLCPPSQLPLYPGGCCTTTLESWSNLPNRNRKGKVWLLTLYHLTVSLLESLLPLGLSAVVSLIAVSPPTVHRGRGLRYNAGVVRTTPMLVFVSTRNERMAKSRFWFSLICLGGDCY